MPWPTPNYSRKHITRAGALLVNSADIVRSSNQKDLFDLLDAYEVLANWRACHGYPINTFQATLRKRLKKIDPGALVAQRLKRTPSIVKKLQRNRGMSLARMQDIGGLRAVVQDKESLEKLVQSYCDYPMTHELVSQYDYVASPKTSGYRSIHLVYRYKARDGSPYDGLLLELQLRTRLQHSWATAVETAGTFLEHSLKSSEGPTEWLSFFSLAGSAFSIVENGPAVPGYEALDRYETFRQMLQEAQRLRVREILMGYSAAVQDIPPGTKRAAFYLVKLDLAEERKTVSITPFRRDQLDQANQAYAEEEKAASIAGDLQVVLVSAGSIESLKRAYPNYFLDTREFLGNLERIKRRLTLRDRGVALRVQAGLLPRSEPLVDNQ